ncbi:MAG: beta-ketoacyl synthase chain length factor [Bacteroides sp.]|nr:beta-ketoacyl synthase chain length factor [Bacteroides sp.]MCM1555788.1 beta-ketoacyl synthase chain length factor [Bacteroides sp.]
MCYIESIATHRNLTQDIKNLVPDATMRRRMSRILKMAVATAVECTGSVQAIAELDAVITATGLGCLADSERFLEQIHRTGEQLLNPTPFIQSTFNTVGAQIALLVHNHCYNMTYVHRSRSFESALLDAVMRIREGDSKRVLVGGFDENTLTQHHIMERMGFWRKEQDGEGAVFGLLTALPSSRSVARLVQLDFPEAPLTEEQCRERYVTSADTSVIFRTEEDPVFPTVSALCFADAVREIRNGQKEAVVYNEYFGKEPTVIVLRCL